MEEIAEPPKPSLRRRIAVAAAVAVLLLLIARVPYVVDATEYAVRTRFGRPVAVVTKPGLHARVPLVDAVSRLDARLLYFDAPSAEFLTNDKKNIVVAPFVLWRIEQPLTFLQTLVTRESAEARLADLVASETGAALGAVPFTRLVSAVAGEADLAGVVAGIGARVRARAAADYGVKVVDVRLKRIAFPEQNLLSVFVTSTFTTRSIPAGRQWIPGPSGSGWTVPRRRTTPCCAGRRTEIPARTQAANAIPAATTSDRWNVPVNSAPSSPPAPRRP